MPVVNIDLSESKSFEPLPEGAYSFTVTSAELKQDSSGREYINWTLTVDEGEFLGRRCWKSTPTSGPNAWSLRELLEACEYEIPATAFGLDPTEVIGRGCIGFVAVEEYNGKLVNRVTKLIRK